MDKDYDKLDNIFSQISLIEMASYRTDHTVCTLLYYHPYHFLTKSEDILRVGGHIR